MTLRAALPMYLIGDAAPAADLLWSALSRHLRAGGLPDVPDRLECPHDLDALWRHPSLLIAQTCGYPLLTSLAGQVRLVATPVYEVPGGEGPYSRSALVVRADDGRDTLAAFAGATAAINGWDSNSGMNLFREAVAPLSRGGRFFAAVRLTGGHLASLDAIASGKVDIAAIDPVSLALAGGTTNADRPALRVLAWTAPTPNLPLVTSVQTSDQTLALLRKALQLVVHDPALAAVRSALRLTGFVSLDLDAYDRIRQAEVAAFAAGYASLDPTAPP